MESELATLGGILLGELLPVNGVTGHIIGVTATNLLLNLYKKYSGRLTFYEKWFTPKSRLCIDRDDKHTFSQLESYITDKFLDQVKLCHAQSKNGEISLSIRELYVKKTLEDSYNGKKILIDFKTSNFTATSMEDEEQKRTSSRLDVIILTSQQASIQELKEFIIEICKYKRTTKTIRVYRTSVEKWGRKGEESFNASWEEVTIRSNKHFSNTVLSGDVTKDLVDDISWFMESEQYYIQRGIPWKRGWLLYGPPGCGKTSIIKATANEYSMDIFTFDLAQLTICRDANSLFSKLVTQTNIIAGERPHILVFEDIEKQNIFPDGRMEYYGKDQHLIWSAILNELDGVAEGDGQLIFMTANNLEKFQSINQDALMRPGRLDKIIKVDFCDNTQAKNLISQFYEGYEVKTDKPVKKDLSPAKLINFMQKEKSPEKVCEFAFGSGEVPKNELTEVIDKTLKKRRPWIRRRGGVIVNPNPVQRLSNAKRRLKSEQIKRKMSFRHIKEIESKLDELEKKSAAYKERKRKLAQKKRKSKAKKAKTST